MSGNLEPVWLPWRVDYLRTSWGKDSPALIASVLGVTRNAVIGKAHRLGLADLGNPIGRAHAPRPAPKARTPYRRRDEHGALKVRLEPAVKRSPAALPSKPNPVPRPVPVPDVVIPSRHAKPRAAVAPTEGALPLSVLKPGQCRWPVTGKVTPDAHRFCGAAVVPERSYCDVHCKRAAGTGTRAENGANLALVKVAQ